jgi:hypothetical protein
VQAAFQLLAFFIGWRFYQFVIHFELAIPRSLLRGHLIEGRVRETAGFSVEQSSFIPRQLAAGY